jgi:hypothetical protein
MNLEEIVVSANQGGAIRQRQTDAGFTAYRAVNAYLIAVLDRIERDSQQLAAAGVEQVDGELAELWNRAALLEVVRDLIGQPLGIAPGGAE